MDPTDICNHRCKNNGQNQNDPFRLMCKVAAVVVVMTATAAAQKPSESGTHPPTTAVSLLQTDPSISQRRVFQNRISLWELLRPRMENYCHSTADDPFLAATATIIILVQTHITQYQSRS